MQCKTAANQVHTLVELCCHFSCNSQEN